MALRELEPFENVVATGRAVLNSKLVLGNTIERIFLLLGGTVFTKALITQIRVRLNAKTVWEVSGTQLDSINQYTGLAASATFLTIDFTEITARTAAGQKFGGVDTTAGVETFTIEVDIAGATAPTLSAFAELTAPKPANAADKLLFRAFLLSTLPVTSAAEHTLDVNVGSNAGALIKRLFIFESAAALLTQFEVKKDAVEIFEAVTPALNDFIAGEHARVPQTQLFVYDRIVDGSQSKSLTTLRANGQRAAFQFKFTSGAAGTFTVQADIYTALALI